MLASLVIVILAIFALRQTLSSIDCDQVINAVRHIDLGYIAVAIVFVAISYGSLTLYDFLALRTIGRSDIPFRVAALASFTSYPIAHGFGAVALISPIIRYRIYAPHGLGVGHVANICLLTGLTFWLGNLTALALSLLFDPAAISAIDRLPPLLHQLAAATMLVAVFGFVIWSWRARRHFKIRKLSVRLPSGPTLLVQIAIGVIDLGAAALAMYVLIPAGTNIGVSRAVVVFIAATLIGFASHAPAGIGVFDATILIGLGDESKESLIAALLMFRLLYHVLPLAMAICLLGAVESWRRFGPRKTS